MTLLEEHVEFTKLADTYEPLMEAQYLTAARKLQAGVNLNELIIALAEGDVEKAYRVAISEGRLTKAMSPITKSIQDKLIPRGGRLGARILDQR